MALSSRSDLVTTKIALGYAAVQDVVANGSDGALEEV